MPIAAKPIVPRPTIPQENVSVQDARYKHSLVCTDNTPLAAILSHIEGQSWIVNYYSQVLATDEQPTEYQPSQLGVYQQYHLIEGLELKLSGPLSTSDEDDTSVMSVTGEATIYPFIKPNKGDVLIADIGDGYAGQFVIDSVNKLTIMTQTCYKVTFILARYMTQELEDSLNALVVETSYYDSNFLVYGQNPVLTSADMQAKDKLNFLYKDILTKWLSDFFSVEFRTVLIPGQEAPTYDKYALESILSVLNVTDDPRIKTITIKNIDGIERLLRMDIWKALIERDVNKLYDCFKKYTLLPRTAIPYYPVFNSIRHSQLNYFIAPNDVTVSVDNDYYGSDNYEIKLLRSLNDANIDLASLIFINSLGEFNDPDPENIYISTEVPVIHPACFDGYYVFSKYYYENIVAGMSKFEIFVKTFFETGNLDKTLLYGFCESIRGWGRLERYYYIPVLLILIKHAQRGI